MLDRRWTQSAGVSGILFVVLVVLTFPISGSPADSTDSTAKMVSYITSNRSGLLISTALGATASSILLVFLGVLSYLLRRGDERSPSGYIVLASGAAAAAVRFLQGIPITGLALVAD